MFEIRIYNKELVYSEDLITSLAWCAGKYWKVIRD